MTATTRPEEETSDTTLADLFARNGESDEQEPWDAGDQCPMIEVRGEDMYVLCEDGVARWRNRDREWSEVDAMGAQDALRDVYDSDRCHNATESVRLHVWLTRWWDVSSLGEYIDLD